MDMFTNKDQNFIRRLDCDIISISASLEELHDFWARALGISGPQWRIILVLADIDEGNGVSVNAVSKILHVASSFVTKQSKLLERHGFICRTASCEDGRIVNMSLTEHTWARLARLGSQQEALNKFILADFAPHDLEELTSRLGSLKKKLERACLKVIADS